MLSHAYHGQTMPEVLASTIAPLSSCPRIVLHALADPTKQYSKDGINQILIDAGLDAGQSYAANITKRVSVPNGSWTSEYPNGGFMLNPEMPELPYVASRIGRLAAELEVDTKIITGDNDVDTDGRITPIELNWRLWSSINKYGIQDNSFSASTLAGDLSTSRHVTTRIIIQLGIHDLIDYDPNEVPKRTSYATYEATEALSNALAAGEIANNLAQSCAATIVAGNIMVIQVPKLAERLGTTSKDSKTRIANSLDTLLDNGLLNIHSPAEYKRFQRLLTIKGIHAAEQVTELYYEIMNPPSKEEQAEFVTAFRNDEKSIKRILEIAHERSTRFPENQEILQRKILTALHNGPTTTTALCELLGVERTQLYTQLDNLKADEKVGSLRKGNQVAWHLAG